MKSEEKNSNIACLQDTVIQSVIAKKEELTAMNLKDIHVISKKLIITEFKEY